MADIKELAQRLLQLGYTKGNLHGDGGDTNDGGYYGGELAPAVVKPKPVVVNLRTSRVSKDFPISHSALDHTGTPDEESSFLISKGWDSTYNLLTNNCSDYTGRFLEDALGISLTNGITTPGKLRRAMAKSPNLLDTFKTPDGVTTIQKIQIPWYDYRKALEAQRQRDLYDYEQNVKKSQGEQVAKYGVNKRIDKLNKEHPKLQYYIDSDGNVIRHENQYVYPSSKTYAHGGLLRRFDGGGQKEIEEVLPEVVVTPYGNYVNYTGEETTVPSISDFFDAKANAARVNAVGNMLNTKHPVIPAVPNAFARNLLVRFGVSDERAAGLLGYDKHPHTCIATTTSQYNDPEAFVPGNITFDKNRTGFVQVGDYDYIPGDLVNLYYKGTPFHSTMVTGVTKSPLGSEYGSPMLTYSNGGVDVPGEETHMRYNMNNLYDDGDDETPDFGLMPGNVGIGQYKVFRYVGSPSRKIDWGREYNSKYGYTVDEKGNAVEPRDKMYDLLAKMQQYGYKFEKTSDGKLRVVRK